MPCPYNIISGRETALPWTDFLHRLLILGNINSDATGNDITKAQDIRWANQTQQMRPFVAQYCKNLF